MGRSPCCSKEGMNRGAWTALEDKVLTDYVKAHGEGKWRNLPKKAGLKRCGKSCRLRWLNYLRPDIKRGNISPDEEELIIRLHKLLGNRWSLIAGRLPGRTDNEIKNYWNTNLGKKVQHQKTSPRPRGYTTSNQQTKMDGNEDQIDSSTIIRTKPLMLSPKPINLLHNIDPQLTNNKSNTSTSDNDHHKVTSTPSVDHSQIDRNLNDGSVYNVDHNQIANNDNVLDFNIGELCLSELFSSEFSNELYKDFNNIGVSQSVDHPRGFNQDQMVTKDWTVNDCDQQFNTFLESAGGNWL